MESSAIAVRLKQQPTPVLHFLPDFLQARDGDIAPGGRLRIDYRNGRVAAPAQGWHIPLSPS